MAITQAQESEKQHQRLAAQRRLYAEAKLLLAVSMVLALTAVAWAFLIAFFPSLKVYAASWGFLVTVLDLAVLVPLQRRWKLTAAKIQELFDCDVLQLDWPDLKAGAKPDAETVLEYSKKVKRHDPGLTQFIAWYPKAVGTVPLYLGRIVCQRINCWWDAKLRRRYAYWAAGTLFILVIGIAVIGIAGKLSVEALILSVVAPLLPALSLSHRQWNEHMESATTLDRLKDHAEKLWESAVAGNKSPDELTRSSRLLQDEIFDHRRKAPLIFDWIYRRLRRDHEEQMNMGADRMIEELAGEPKSKH